MARSDPEKLAEALRANLRRRKATHPAKTGKAPAAPSEKPRPAPPPPKP